QFDLAKETGYEYSVAVFDNCGRGELPPGHTTYGDGQYQILRFAPETQSTPAPTSTPSTPGFEGVFVGIGLLSVACLLRRRK
ncbi:MAG: hypothetical protein K0B37_17430, partial [Bacteroidales bacterium]|nr:hypothetical protein [Bacteroidales bacterium]